MADDCVGITHERYTTIVPFPLTNMPSNLAVSDPMSQHLTKAAQEPINVEFLPEVLDTLALADSSFVKLKRWCCCCSLFATCLDQRHCDSYGCETANCVQILDKVN